MNDIKESLSEYNEIDGNLYLMSVSNLDVDVEVSVIKLVLNFITKLKEDSFGYNELLENNILVNIKTNEIDYNLLDKALYKLFILGYIDVWNLVYSKEINHPTYINIRKHDLSNEDLVKNVEKYIRKYEFDYKYEGEMDTKAIVTKLVEWTFKNFTMTRLNSLLLTYKYCNEYQTNEELWTAIEGFLKVDVKLRKVIRSYKVSDWFKYLKSVSPEVRIHKVNRLLEVYMKSTVLNFLYIATQLERKEYDSDDIESRLAFVMNQMNTNQELDREVFLEYCYEYFKYDNESLNYFIKYISKDKYLKIYKETENELVLMELIKGMNERIVKIGCDYK
jgi:hypothetical protein